MVADKIEDYALIGDLHTGALVGRDGSIDWLCLPRFDSPACFAALLDDESAGHWRIAPVGAGNSTRRRYREDTLIMESEWDVDGGQVRVIDCMPPRREAADVVRIVEGISGRVRMKMQLRIRFDYGHVVPWVRHDNGGVVAIAGPDTLYLTTPVELHGEHMETFAEFEVEAGQKVPFVLTHASSHVKRPKHLHPDRAVTETADFWREWINQCTYRGKWNEEVRRALIFLKALTYQPTGGITAAATTSLPEQLGGVRNWDYRYCWLRDATFTLQALLGTGFIEEAQAWREWLVRAVAGDPAKLQIMYGLDGTRRLPEQELDWLSGFHGSTPVRIGNEAAGQFQLDVYGEVLDGLHLARNAGLPVEHNAWDVQRALLDFLEGHWDQPDASLWEIRGENRHFVHSKVMAWAGVDRAVHTVESHGLDGPIDRWRKLRDRIHEDVCTNGFDAERGTFTQFYGSKGLDAALLLIPRVGFLPWSDKRVIGTVDAVQKDLCEDGFLMRYRPDADGGVDGLPGTEGAFLACTFWLADALAGIGRTDESQEVFERLLSLRNDVGMLSEEYDTKNKVHLGNTPQAFSMVGLVNTARQLGGSLTTTSATSEDQNFHSD
ncbi:glycoside hydrolase family 15 protein [Skermania sp. ID1734]|uniref:glycoside hydrolase family 15 protein n=1 Tax=Skermania sp. ID1734 TaxID=2597516 RepID=UPI00117D4331|nr:glycoside hydrolase family 15 protein [Skermania sp. ID1734]TSD99483.1 glycoside hydrolase family 15 protein [Skermania sp. ID1734]